MLDVHRLRILREIAHRGTVTAAAKALWLTPPSVSHHVAALEQETGVQLLERVGRRVRLTPAAERLVENTEQILASIELAEADLALAREEIAGSVSVAGPETAASRIIVPAAAELMRKHPALEVRIADGETPWSLTEVRRGAFDIAVGLEYTFAPLPEEPGLDLTPLMDEPVYIVLPEGHPRARSGVKLADLKNEHWIVASEPNP